MKYGTYYGLTGCVVFALFSLMGIDQQSTAQSWLSYLIMAVFIYISGVHYREREKQGFISYSEGFKTGVTTVFFGSVILSFFSFLYVRFVDQELITRILEQTEQSLIEKGMSDDEIEKTMEITSRFTTPGMIAFFGVAGGTFVGAIISLVVAAIIKKENTDFNSFTETT